MDPVVVRLRTKFEFPSEEVFHWHLSPGAIYRMIPPWEKVEVVSHGGNPSQVGSTVVLNAKIGPFSFIWEVKHAEFIEGKSFTDIQVKGPFTYWKHTHTVYPIGDSSCEWEDTIEFIAPFSILNPRIEKKLKRMLEWRHRRLRNELYIERRYPAEPMRILISGTSGLVGSEVYSLLRSQGHEVVRLLRKGKSKKKGGGVYWDPSTGDLEKEDFEGFDAVIHLAGKNIAHFWTKKQKKEIFISRCRDSWLLSQVLLRMLHPPKTLICASAVGYYGDGGKETLVENSPKGKGFLADVCQKWEESTLGIENRGTRGVHTRFGIVLSSKGGMLARVLPLFRMGLGAVLGTGKQYVSWISLDDVAYGIYHTLLTKEIEGPVNFTAPAQETSRSFSEKIARAVHRPLFLRIGKAPLRFALGEMAEEMLLTSVFAPPEKLKATGYQFVHPTLEETLKSELP